MKKHLNVIEHDYGEGGDKKLVVFETKDIAQRVVANVSAKYQILDNLSVQSRASYDKSFFTYDNRMYAGTDLTLSPATGRYTLNKSISPNDSFRFDAKTKF